MPPAPPPAPPTLACPVCGSQSFETRRGIMETRAASILGLTGASRGCTDLICRGCHYVMTFADPA